MYVLPNPNWFLPFCLCLPVHHLNCSSTYLLLISCPQDWFVDSLSDMFDGPLTSFMCPGMLWSTCFSCVSTSEYWFAACMVTKLVLKRALRLPSAGCIIYTWWTDLCRDESASLGITYSIWGSGISSAAVRCPDTGVTVFLLGLILIPGWCTSVAAILLVWTNSKATCVAVAA